MPDPAQQIADLRATLNEADRLYRLGSETGMSDRAWDEALKQLEQLEAQHPDLAKPGLDTSPTQRVGGEPIDGFQTIGHSSPMLSIDNTYSRGELDTWISRTAKSLGVEEFGMVMEPKVDGVALALRYEHGTLVQALTRGDGAKGDDITHNIRTVRSIPLELADADRGVPDILEARGEVFLPADAFAALNAQREKDGQDLFANPRNTTAGTLKQKDPKNVAPGLRFIAYGKGEVSPDTYETYTGFTAALRALGIPIHEHEAVVTSADDAWAWIEKFDQLRHTLPYATDGLVIKVNRYDQQRELGANSKAPRWCIAYKFAAEKATTKLLEVNWQVGKTGKLTPRATMTPTLLAGTTVTHATLHNADQIANKDIRIGDHVVIEKAGEIIPQVVRVLPENRTGKEKPIPVPKVCPKCSTAVDASGDEVDLRCPNPECPAQLRERLIYFSGRNQMDIDGLGPEVIDQLLDRGMVSQYADLYGLDEDALAELTHESTNRGKVVLVKLGKKNASRIVESLGRSKEHSLAKVLGSLGIRHIGSSTAKLIASKFDGLASLLEAEKDAVLIATKETGYLEDIQKLRTAANSLHASLHSETGTKLVSEARERSKSTPVNEVKLLLESIPNKQNWGNVQWGKSGGGRKDHLLHHYQTLDDLLIASPEDFFDIFDKSVVGHSLYSYITSDQGRSTLLGLRQAGLRMESAMISPRNDGHSEISGKKFVITGSFPGYTRNALKEKLESLGAKVTGSISKNTDVLLAGDKPGSKLRDAEQLNIEVWSLNHLNNLLDADPPASTNLLFGSDS